MFLPIGDDQVRGGYSPHLAYGLIVVNVIIFIYQSTLTSPEINSFLTTYGAIPIEITNGQDHFTLLTSMFLHGGLMHLVGNMLLLWIFADNVEASVGSVVFLVVYLVSGLAAHAGQILINPESTVPMVGASGALAGIMGAYLIMFPRSKVRGYLFVFRVAVPAFLFLFFWIAQQSYMGYTQLQSGPNNAGGVAWWAHVGGFLFGVIAGLVIRQTHYLPKHADGYQMPKDRDVLYPDVLDSNDPFL
ncbi:MAG: rhomboid family intramembrane serine protease [Bacteroidota bacterium]